MDGDSIMHQHPSEIVIFTHLSNGEEVNEASQQNDLLDLPQQQQSSPSPQVSRTITEPNPQSDQISDCNNEFVGGMNKIVKGLDNVDLYLCEKCNRTFKQKSRYERHIANHPSEKHYLCETCNKTFTRMSHLEKHIRTHTEERRHVCEVCGAAFILPHHLVRHSLIHSGIRPFQCEVCNKQFTRKAGLTQHQYLHTGIRPYVCFEPACGKQFTDRTTLRRHVLTHSKEKPFICKECDKTFRTKSACRKHYLRHFKDSVSFKCGVCEEMFKDAEELRVHSESHDEKRRTGAHRCGFCLRVFKSQNDLDVHVPLHESGLVHLCNHCPAKFYTPEDLVHHTSKHFDTVPPMPTNCSSSDDKQQPSIKQQIDNNTTTPDNEMNKVLVVLQLPQTITNLKNEQGTLQLQHIQQLLGTARFDKLVVTTDPITNSSQTLALELSQDQQESIQNILQTTNIIQTNVTSPIATMNDPDSSLDDLTSHDTLGPEDLTSPVHSTPFVLKSLSHQSAIVEEPSPKSVSQYLIVPPPPNSDFTSVVEKTNFSCHDSPAAAMSEAMSKLNKTNKLTSLPLTSTIGNSSVFKAPPAPMIPSANSIVQQLQLLVDEDVGGVSQQQQNESDHHFQTNPSTVVGDSNTIQMTDLEQDGSNSSDVINGDRKIQTTETSYYHHADSEYENSLDGGLLAQTGHSNDFIVTN